ncbi:carbohydrate ABC transporter permease [Nonomuraea sediminis]|uniref:carbohydrate ABC transporter permease n=1 Tax=Nonomuraea sediminis TaxID=2835864 RepID=UPI001BDD3529|nr:sugar ABC transporter permease [Nonomuraea sediminis]
MAHTSTISRGGGDTAAPGRRRRPPAGRRASGLPPWVLPYALLLPGLLVIAVLLLYPLYQMVDMSFHKVGLRQIRPKNPLPADFVGTHNYTEVFKSDLFAMSLRNTLVFALVAVALTLVVGTLVGLLLHKLGRKMSMLVMVGSMAAWAVPPASAAVVWKWLFDADNGVVNWLFRLDGKAWFNDSLDIYVVLIITVVWASFPFIAVSVLAGLKSIPSELYEAAKVDGSTGFHTFRKITFPMLRPVFSVLVVLSIIWDVKVFTQLFIQAGGTNMPREAYNFSMWSYIEAFSPPPDMGFGAAIAVVLTVILLLITFVYVRQIVKTEDVK